MGLTRGAPIFFAVLAALLPGCGGNPGVPPAPPTDLTLSWASFDGLVFGWTRPAEEVSGFAVEGRIGSGPFEPLPADLRSYSLGGQTDLDPRTPELVEIGVRVRSYRGRLFSEYTPEATIIRSFRPPSELVVHAQGEDVSLSWTRGSAVADGVLVERAVWNSLEARLGPYETVTALPGAPLPGWMRRPRPPSSTATASATREATRASLSGALPWSSWRMLRRACPRRRVWRPWSPRTAFG